MNASRAVAMEEDFLASGLTEEQLWIGYVLRAMKEARERATIRLSTADRVHWLTLGILAGHREVWPEPLLNALEKLDDAIQANALDQRRISERETRELARAFERVRGAIEDSDPGAVVTVRQRNSASISIEQPGAMRALPAPETEGRAEPLPQNDGLSPFNLVTLENIGAITKRTKRQARRWYDSAKLPEPDFPGKQGQAHRWHWSNVRNILEQLTGIRMPLRYPSLNERPA